MNYTNRKQPSAVAAATFDGPVDAQLAAGMLESNGISVIVNSQAMSGVYPLGNVNSNFGVSIYVSAEDYDRAMKLLREHGDI